MQHSAYGNGRFRCRRLQSPAIKGMALLEGEGINAMTLNNLREGTPPPPFGSFPARKSLGPPRPRFFYAHAGSIPPSSSSNSILSTFRFWFSDRRKNGQKACARSGALLAV
jgi:hypothetical protein